MRDSGNFSNSVMDWQRYLEIPLQWRAILFFYIERRMYTVPYLLAFFLSMPNGKQISAV